MAHWLLLVGMLALFLLLLFFLLLFSTNDMALQKASIR